MEEFHFGDSLLARWDMPHAAGGAVTSNHVAFLNWLNTTLGADYDVDEPSEEGPYRKWSDKEKDMWDKNHMSTESTPECVRPN